MNRKPCLAALFLFMIWPALLNAQKKGGKDRIKYSAYLFAYFTGNNKSEEAIRFALSSDGFNYRSLNGNQPVISSEKISSTGGVRDPHILRGADGKTFYMVATDMVSAKGWSSNRAMVLLKSTDLVNWTSSVVNIQKRFPGNEELLRVWAPQTIYDPEAGKYMIYFSMKHGNDPDKIYYAYANADFTDLETVPKQLFFSPTNGSCIDGDIIYHKGKYHLFFKTEGDGAGIKKAVSKQLTGGYVLGKDYVDQTDDAVEGSGTFPLIHSKYWVLMYDVYMKGKYQFTKSKDLEKFKVVDNEVTMNFHPRHGTVIRITSEEAERLVQQWGSFDDVFQSGRSAAIKKSNIFMDSIGSVFIPVRPGTNLSSFNPEFQELPGLTWSPKGAQNFSAGPVKYVTAIKGNGSYTFEVTAAESANPVLEGNYADPDILYAQKTGLFYLYPTSDGFQNWSGTYFKTFSSKDLVHWKDEGVILDLPRDVSWGKKNAWAPCIIERKVGSTYKYYYYFTAAQKIGVAVSDDPKGPFKDIGRPLVDGYPEGIKRGQQIDPEVFADPATGKHYLYWGNTYMAGAELGEDMISIKPGTTQIMTPDTTFREGTTVFYRNGRYYFMWSEDDTRSPNYKVRYGTSDAPLGKITIPANNLVLAKNTEAGIYATGHNSILQIPGKDEWYIVYHRFMYPEGINMGRAAGYFREVCIDRLEFGEDGCIQEVIPTHKGIKAVEVQK